MHISVLSVVRRTLPRTAAAPFSTIGKALAAAALWGACSLAQAGVLSFDDLASRPVTAGSIQNSGQYWFETYAYGATTTADVVGAIVDGGSATPCPSTFTCPVNHASTYYAALNDGFFYFGLQNHGLFSLQSLQASVIGEGQDSFPRTAGALLIQGFNTGNQPVGNAQTLFLPGPNASGDFTFSNYSTPALADLEFSYVRIYTYGCNFAGNCSRTQGLGNVAFDNIVTSEATAVPEPGTLALFALGLAGIGFSRRRKG